MKGVVLGLGSIGSRHVRNLLAEGVRDLTIVRRSCTGNEWGLPEADGLDDTLLSGADFAIVCTPTDRHASDLTALSRAAGLAILCEKPLVQDQAGLDAVLRLPWSERICRVAFNMRYHPVVTHALALLESGTLGSVRLARFSVGQYLPDWRPGRNHKDDYSAHWSRGGGVALDLIHEIDLAERLVGPAARTTSATAARLGDVTVDSEDFARWTYETTDRAQVSVELDYLTRGMVRTFVIAAQEGTLLADLHANRLVLMAADGTRTVVWENGTYVRNDMYVAMIRDFVRLVGREETEDRLPTFAEAVSAQQAAIRLRESL